MTSASPPTIYPQYCFHLSPTIHRWCHFRTADIQALDSHPGFEGQNLFFHRNHPVKWVRVAGVVVAVDEYPNRCIYTVDDSSGSTIECVVNGPNPKMQQLGGMEIAKAKELQAAGKAQMKSDNSGQRQLSVDAEIDVGHVLEVKGGIRMFRDAKQIHVEKIMHLKSTEQEVQFWERVALLRRETLDKPWILDRKIVRQCRREAEGPRRDELVPRGKPKAASTSERALDQNIARRARKLTGLERRTKRDPGSRGQ